MTEPAPPAAAPFWNLGTPEPPAMPAAREDPAIVAGYATQDTYQPRLDQIRNDPMASELAKAEQVTAAYEQHNAELDRLQGDLHGRRTARLEHLQARIPAGPGYPADASAADRAVLAAAFRGALDQARGASMNDRRTALDDALRFGDDTQIRALITAAQEAGDTKLVDRWAAATGSTAALEEIRALREEIEGRGPSRPWAAQAFHRPGRPMEAANLPVLRQRAEQAAQQQARDRVNNFRR